MKKKSVILSFLLLLFIAQLTHASSLKKDEEVIFFPTSAHQLSNGDCEVPIHAWVFESEKESLTHKISIKIMGELIEGGAGLSDKQVQSAMFHRRLAWFLTDNERNKKLSVVLNNKTYPLTKSTANGHSYTQITTPCIADKGGWVTFNLQMPAKDKRPFQGQVQLIPRTGISVISDIDDTIKISEVLDKKALIRNTFVEPFQPTQGMPEYYQQLKNDGAYFHYVSASPWQLYPELKGFMEAHYPKGSIALRHFRVKDSSLLSFLKSSKDYKLKTLREIIQRYPEHQFILIGDNGEHDPEIYAEIATEFPKNITSILIRDVAGSSSEGHHLKKIPF